ncbi:hypothetical protein Tco_1245284 [Tanacetum coccineum]
MLIPDAFLTDEIKGAPYYSGYLEHVAEYQRYLDGEHSKAKDEVVPESPAPKATKVAKPKTDVQTTPSAPKTTKAKKLAGDKAPKPTSSQLPKPTPAPTEPSKKYQRKKRKLVKETYDTPSPAKRSKAGKVSKMSKPKSTIKLVDEFVDEGVPVSEPRIDDEEADFQKEPDSGRFQQLLEVQGKGKEKAIEEQAAHDLLTLQTPKKKSHADQFIFQRRTPMPTEPSGHVEPPSSDLEQTLTDNETKSDKEVPGMNAGVQDEGQVRSDPGKQDEGQARSNPGDAAESQPQSSHVVHARPNLEHMDLDTTDSPKQQNLEQMDEEFTTTTYPNVQENLKLPNEGQVVFEEPTSSTRTLSSLQILEKDLSFTDQFLMEKSHEDEPEKAIIDSEVQSMVTVPIQQDTSLVPPMTTSVIDLTTSQCDSSTIHAPLLTSTATTTTIATTTTLPPPPQPQQSTTESILLQRIAVNEIVTDAVDWAMQAPLRARFSDLPTVDMKEILQQRMFEDKSYEAHEDHNNLYEALQKSLERDYSDQLLSDLKEARKKKRKRRNVPSTPSGSPPSQPPPPPHPAGASCALGTSGASGSSQMPPPLPPSSTGTSGSTKQQGSEAPSSSKTIISVPQSMAWTTSDTQYESVGASRAQEFSPTDSLMHDDSIPDEQVHISDDEDSKNDHLPKVDSRQDWWKPLPAKKRSATPEPAWTIPSSIVSDVENNWASAMASTYEPPAENSLLAKTRDMTAFINWYCQQVNKIELTQADLEGQAYEIVKALYPDVINLQFQMEECHKMLTDQVDWSNPKGDHVRIDVNRPLPLGGPLGHATIQIQFFFNKDLEYLRYGSKGSSPALSVSKMKAARYPKFGLELLVPKQMWIDEVCTYDISAKYGISHWWFNQQKFYIDRHDSHSHRKEVITHMRILSVVRIKAYSRYRYDYLSEIVLRRADFQEYTIAKKDFKNMYPSDFEDLNILLLQGHLNHLPSSDKRMLSTAVKLWTRNLVIRQRHDYTIIESPRAVVFPVDNRNRKMMRFNEIYKFSDGTLTRILEALDYRVKEFNVKSKRENKGRVPAEMELVLEQTQQGTSHEVSVSTEGVEELKRNVRINGEKKEALHTPRQKPDSILQAGNPVKEILFKLNLPDHRCFKMVMELPGSAAGSRKVKFIATCSYSRLNDCITSRKNEPKLPQTLMSTSSSVCQRDEVLF